MREARLRKAISLYEKSYRLLCDANAVAVATGNPLVDLVAMALLNNMAQLSFERTDYQESRRMFDHLIHFTTSIASSTYGDQNVTSLMDLQKQNFLLNAIILSTPVVAAAA